MDTPSVRPNDFVRMWQETEADVLGAVREVGESGWYILGKRVESFERALAAATGLRHAVGCASGLDALELALRALGLRAGDAVLTTPLTAFATSLAIVRAGGVPWFVDVDASGLVDLDQAEQVLHGKDAPRFFVPVHLYGHALDLPRLQSLRERLPVQIIEDCAQAVAARSAGVPVGSVGDASALSFYPTKNLGALGDGGAVLCNRDDVQLRCRVLRDYGQSAKYVHDELGMNSRLDEVHAAILERAFLPKLRQWTARRHEVARRYLAGIDSPYVQPVPVPAGSESVWHLFPVLVDAGHRDAFITYLKGTSIVAGVHYPKLVSDQRALEALPARTCFPLAHACRISACEVSLPIHPHLQASEIEHVIEAVNRWQP